MPKNKRSSTSVPAAGESLPCFEATAPVFSGRSNQALRDRHRLFSTIARFSFLMWLPVSVPTVLLRFFPALKRMVRKRLYSHFCGGEDVAEALFSADKLHAHGVFSILDYAAEGKCREEDFERSKQEVLLAINKAAHSSAIPFCVVKPSCLGNSALMGRAQRGEALRPAELQALDRAKGRLDDLCRRAQEAQIRLLVDAEESTFQGWVDEAVTAAMQRHNTESAVVYNTFQFYLKGAQKAFLAAHAAAQRGGFFLGAKLVRGAYMEKERKLSRSGGYESPIQATKEDCDRDFNAALAYCARHHKTMGLCVATHNEHSNRYFTERMQQFGIPKRSDHIFFAQLLGMSDHLTYGLARAGYNVAKYVPYGPFDNVLPYLYRRVQENSAVRGQVNRELHLIRRELKRRKSTQ